MLGVCHGYISLHLTLVSNLSKYVHISLVVSTTQRHKELFPWVVERTCKCLSKNHRMHKCIPKWITGKVPVGVTLTKRKSPNGKHLFLLF